MVLFRAKRTVERTRPAIETLESRQLLAGDPSIIQALPWGLEFDKPSGGIVDRYGKGTGFTYIQPNATSTEYRKGLIQLRAGAGILRVSSLGDSYGTTNDLVNGLQTGFSALTKTFTASVVLRGPISLPNNGQGAGVLVGPDQNNFVRLALVNRNGTLGIQFVDEQKLKTGLRHQLNPATITNIGSISSISRLELALSGNPKNGYITAFYSVNGSTFKQVPITLVVKKDKRPAFFAPNAYAGVTAFSGSGAPAASFAFESFTLKRGLTSAGQGGQGKISVSTSTKYFNDVRGGGTSETKKITVSNAGEGSMSISSIVIDGADANQFTLINKPATPFSLAPGASASFSVAMNATSSTTLGLKTAGVTITSSVGSRSVPLRGLATLGQGGANEPSLQWIMDLYQIPIRVGTGDPSSTFLPSPLATPNDQVNLQQMTKAGDGPVTIQPLAAFGVGSSTSDQSRLGYYSPGTTSDVVQILSLRGAGQLTQTVNPVVSGSTSFDPGAVAFSLYANFPSMNPAVVKTPGGTWAFGEDYFNSYDSSDQRKIRFYPLKDPSGAVVANAYVFACEDLNAAYDTQDFVGIIRNVKPAATGPEIGFVNLSGAPYGNRMVFNRIQNLDPNFPNVVHDTAKVRILNSGDSTLSVTGMDLSARWELVSGATPFSLAPGQTKDVTLRFIGNNATAQNEVVFGHLTLTTNDPDEASANIELAGFWQKYSENQTEPKLVQLMSMLGYTQQIVGDGQVLNNGGKVEAVGEEILSPFWTRADSSYPISVRQLGAWHTQGNPAVLKWYPQGSSVRNVIFTSDGTESQSFLPFQENSSSLCYNTFTTSGVFAFKVDGESSEDTTNVQEQSGGGWGHHVRFWPVRDREGNLVPNTYLMAMDYNGINYDYNDNTYLVTNIKPAGA